MWLNSGLEPNSAESISRLTWSDSPAIISLCLGMMLCVRHRHTLMTARGSETLTQKKKRARDF